MRVLSYLPTIHTGQGPSYTASSIASALADLCPSLTFYTPWSIGDCPDNLLMRSAGRLRLPYRLINKRLLLAAARRRIESIILSDLDAADGDAILHIWPGADVEFVIEAKRRGARIFREMINTHEGFAKAIVDRESRRLGLPPQHGITPASVDREQEFLSRCDTILSPSAIVDDFLTAAGFDQSRICKVSFGWDPGKVLDPSPTASAPPRTDGPVTALFVGSIGVRKGLHLALEAWKQARVDGTFVLLGRVEPGFRAILDRYLEPGRIEHVDFVAQPQSFFQNADFFLFPTLEEGAPLVCYEACASGLPVITGPAGTARMIEDGLNGYVVDPHDAQGLRSAIEKLADPNIRRSLGENARQRALHFTWREAAKQRLECFAR